MSEVTTKFSLKEASLVLKPHIEYLPFSTLAKILDYSNRKAIIRGEECSLTQTGGTVYMPINLDLRVRAIDIPVSVYMTRDRERVIAQSLVYVRLDSGGTDGYWYRLTSVFSPFSELQTLVWWSSNVMFTPIKSESEISELRRLPDLRQIIWECLSKHIRHSLQNRRGIISRLEELEGVCDRLIKAPLVHETPVV